MLCQELDLAEVGAARGFISHIALRTDQLLQWPKARCNTLFKMRLYSVYLQSKPNNVTHFPLFFRDFYLIITAIGKRVT